MSHDRVRDPIPNPESKYFTNTMACTTRNSVSVDLDLSDGGFVDDMVDIVMRDPACTEETSFTDGVETQLDIVLQDEEFKEYRSKFDCMCTFLPMKSYGGLESSRILPTVDLTEGRGQRQGRGHIVRNLTFIRLV